MANFIPLLRLSNLFPFFHFFEKLGATPEKLVEQCKLSVFGYEEPNLLISRHQGFTFLEKIGYQEGIENLGLVVGEKTSFDSFGILGKLACQSLTLYDAISKIIYLGNFFNSGENYWLIERGKTAYFCQQYINLGGFDPHHASHFSLMLMIDLVRKVAGEQWYPQQISLQTRMGNFRDHPLREVLLNRDMAITSIAFPRYFLALPFPSGLNLREDQQHQESEQLQNSAPSSQFSHSLAQAIAARLREGYPSLHIASEIAQMSIRSLQRRLAEECLTYSQLITRIRYEKAVYLLQNSNLKIIEIGYDLGCRDPAHFTRAFKSWTGRSPQQFRHSQII